MVLCSCILYCKACTIIVEGPARQSQFNKWTDEEFQALISFLMLYTDGNSWPSHKDENFWDKAGAFIQQQLQTNHCRTGRVKVYAFVCINSLTGKSCRTKVTT